MHIDEMFVCPVVVVRTNVMAIKVSSIFESQFRHPNYAGLLMGDDIEIDRSTGSDY